MKKAWRTWWGGLGVALAACGTTPERREAPEPASMSEQLAELLGTSEQTGRPEGALPPSATPPGELGWVALPGPAKQIAVGADHACALLRDGAVACWGGARFHQLGDLTDVGRRTARLVPGLTGVRAIAAGDTATCAQLGTGELVCWGARYAGMSDEVYDVVKAPTTVVQAVDWARGFALGGARGAYVRPDGGVAIWSPPVEAPIPIEGFAGVTQVAVGYENVCARGVNGAVRCMGPNYGGEAGNGGDGEEVEPVDVVGASELVGELYEKSYQTCGASPAEAACATTLSGAVDLDANGRLTCAVLASGRVACWGAGRDERAKWLGALDFARVPILVRGIDDAVEVAVGWGQVCARRRSGGVACWGDNDGGRLGVAPAQLASSSSARPVVGLEKVVQVEAGDEATCALDEAGRVGCWGAGPIVP